MPTWNPNRAPQNATNLRDIARDQDFQSQLMRNQYEAEFRQGYRASGPGMVIDLSIVFVLFRAWRRFSRRHLPRPVRVTINTAAVVFAVLCVVAVVHH
jgi:hypothetical protein